MKVVYRDIFDPNVWARVVAQYVRVLPKFVLNEYGFNLGEYALGGSGLSGGLIVVPVAKQLGNTQAIIVRKPGEKAHSRHVVEPNKPNIPWVFLDDFIDSGATLRRCTSKLGPPICGLVYGDWHRPPGKIYNIWSLEHEDDAEKSS